MGLEGRGAHYTFTRHLNEEFLDRLFRGGWPARLAEDLGLLPRLRTLEYDLPIATWPAGAPRLRLAFASDFHAGPTTTPRQLDDAAAALAAARPDVLLLGGDFVYLRTAYLEPLAQALSQVPAPLGRFAVLGNHDLWADDRAITRRLEAAGVQVLINQAVPLPPPFSGVAICGLDEPWTGRPDATATLRGADGVRVVLMHAPSGLLCLHGQRFELALCGHTHGGHIALPGGIPVVIPGLLSRRYPHGRHALANGGTLLVSRGVGGSELPLRLFADPDILICDLHAP